MVNKADGSLYCCGKAEGTVGYRCCLDREPMSSPQPALVSTVSVSHEETRNAPAKNVHASNEHKMTSSSPLRGGLAVRLVIFYFAFVAISVLVVGFSSWQISIAVKGASPWIPWPASVMLLIAGIGLVAEFLFGARISFKELRG
jgi:hypothetical protein